MAARTPLAERLFSSQLLSQLERQRFVTKRTFLGRVKGERKSPRKGISPEFYDYRPYEIGDDLRYVDWNIFGRLDRLYLKLFVEEEDLCVHLLIDASASMDFGSPSKFQYGLRLIAALGFIALVGLERVGVGIVRDRVVEGWSPTRGRNQFLPLIEFLGGVTPGGVTDLNGALRDYALRARDSGLAVLVSDLMDQGGFALGIRAFLERRFDVHVIHLLSREEMEPGYGGDLRLVDAESGETREATLDGETLKGYRRRLREFLDQSEATCRANKIVYHRAVTAEPMEDLILRRLKGTLLQ